MSEKISLDSSELFQYFCTVAEGEKQYHSFGNDR